MGDESADLWIFGYGSLVWRPAFPHLEGRPARLAGWVRRFWQGSTDHRGVPGAPGRVVTLVPEDAGGCAGMAYRVAAPERQAVLEGLDFREKGGYRRLVIELELDEPRGAVREALTYVATPENPNYLGPATLEVIAAQVRASRGPSGSNLEYVLRLAASLRRLEARDPHVFALEAALEAGPGPGSRDS